MNSLEAVEEVVRGGARYAGFVFYPPSPRSLNAKQAADLTACVPPEIIRVGLFVNPTDRDLDAALDAAELDWIQLHGAETPERTAGIKAQTGRPVIKVIKVSSAEQIGAAVVYRDSADWLLFDAKPPEDMTCALPGGNAVVFDWTLLANAQLPLPWMLAGGLDSENLAVAISESGARTVDVSSGVEDRPGIKNPAKIRAFLAAAQSLA